MDPEIFVKGDYDTIALSYYIIACLRQAAIVAELNFAPFNIDIGQFDMELSDLKSKDLWSAKFVRLSAELEMLEKKMRVKFSEEVNSPE